ncbi:MAG: DUF4174 domain-containing protein [Hyphomicrobiaceae bacterium]
MTRSVVVSIVAASVIGVLFAKSANSANTEPPLIASLWKHRPLIVFAPHERSQGLENQRMIVGASRCGLGDRDMAIVEVIGDEVQGDLEPNSEPKATEFRKYYGIKANEFRVVLVGKDGTAKLTSASPVSSEQLFRLIDTMPMRKVEVSRRAGKTGTRDCG